MSSVTIFSPRIPSPAAGAGARLYAAFLAGRSPHTLRAYGADLEAFSVFLGDPGPGAALSHLIGLPAGDGNGVLLAYRAHMIDAGLTPATINRRLAAIRSALKLARTLGLTAWAPEIRGRQPPGPCRSRRCQPGQCALKGIGMGRTAKKAADPGPPYTPTEGERQAAQRVLDRRAAKAPPPRFKVETPAANLVNISADHPEPKICHTLLAGALGTGDYEFAGGLLTQLTDVSRSGKIVTKQELNFMLSVVAGINPRDETEALLAAQMAAIHNATMVAARRLNHVETIAQQDSASSMLNKLARTFASQVEALKKYRSAGEQTIKVQHVTVNEGGQAIVGNVSQGGGGTSKDGGQPYEPCAADECGPALLGHEQAIPTPMPGTGGQGLEGVPVPRRAGRGA